MIEKENFRSFTGMLLSKERPITAREALQHCQAPVNCEHNQYMHRFQSANSISPSSKAPIASKRPDWEAHLWDDSSGRTC